ncbi:MAG TPA: hypothetical protein VLE89_06305 [Chlamydiales bacterium]|nr:hypothetical protein [Chlamydiales bacterium]
MDLFNQAVVSHYVDICPIQDSLRYRARHLGLRVANLLIDEKGELDRGCLKELVDLLAQGSYLLGPRREGDAFIYNHLVVSLQALQDQEEIWAALRKFSPPLVHKKAEELIRMTLWPEPIRAVQTPQIRRAALAAWLTLLRQTTGSCFATAPAILIQKNPLRFLKDIYDLLTTGRLKRIVAGKEYAVPLNPSLGRIDLQKPLRPSVEHSPALIAALEAGELVSSGSFEQKVRELKQILENREPFANIESLIRSLSMEAAGLSEEDLEEEERLSQLQMDTLLAKQTAIHYQRPSERAQKVSEWKKKFEKACMAFQSFADCALLRSWEYTIASFCDVKVDFARWNLYVGLGLNSEEKGGIGQFLYQFLNRHLQRLNEEAARHHQEYEQNMGAAQAIERSNSRLNQELGGYVHAANQALQLRDQALEKAEGLSKFFSSLIQQYDQKLQENFQELFDPSLAGVETHLYEDSPAGFRLVYKHGRSDSSQWTSIHSGEEYSQSLRDFFSSIEADIEVPSSLGHELLSELTTGVIQWIQQPEFLESAIKRARARGRESPWEYISGGTMETLLQAYCSRERPFKEVSTIPHSEEELMQFLMREGKVGPLLIHSPTHAFIYYPPEKWESKRWNQKWKLNEIMQEHLTHRFSERLLEKEKALFLHLYRQKSVVETLAKLRDNLIDTLQSMKASSVKNPIAEVDSFLYEQTPLFSNEQAQEALRKLFKQFPSISEATFSIDEAFLGPYELQQKAKEMIFNHLKTPFSSVDWDGEIAKGARRLELCYPDPVVFADSNWSGWLFGFIVNPATNQLELWRLNRTATQGYPMNDWREWLSSKNSSPWILLTDPKEYLE